MDWTDTAIVLHVRPHGENNAVLEAFTCEHGRHSGLVRGGRSRRLRPALQTGNLLNVEWRARLPEQLGFFTLELSEPYSAGLLDDRLALSAIGVISSLCELLAERDPHPALFEMTQILMEHMDDADIWPQLFVRWELRLLSELGVGLDLGRCAATGSQEDLLYVSPKSGCAVSAVPGEPYKDRLLALPLFLRSVSGGTASVTELTQGFALTGYFLENHVYAQQNKRLPTSRQDFLKLLLAKKND